MSNPTDHSLTRHAEEPASDPLAAVLARARDLARYEWATRVARGLFLFSLVAAGGLGMSVFASGLSAPYGLRLGALAASMMAACAAIAWTARQALRGTSPVDVAVAAERRFPSLRDSFVTSVELAMGDCASESPWTPSSTSSAAIADALATKTQEAVETLHLRDAIDSASLWRLATAAASVAVVLIASALLFPHAWAGLMRAPSGAPPAINEPVAQPPLVPSIVGPTIADVRLTLTYPEHTGRAEETRAADLEDISIPVGTQVRIAARVSGQDAKVSVAVNSDRRALTLGEDGEVQEQFRITRDVAWRLTATDASGEAMNTPECRITAISDRSPKVALTEPGRNISIPSPRPVRIAYLAEDDYGVRAVTLEWRGPNDDGWQAVPLWTGSTRSTTGAWQWDLRPMRLVPGQSVTYRLAARDNDTVTGPKTARTEAFSIAIGDAVTAQPGGPPPDEQAAEKEAEGLEALEQEAEELGRQLDELVSRMQQGEMSADEESRRAAELSEAQRRVAEQADRVSRSLAESERQMARREDTSPDLLEKMQELHDLLQEAMNEELAEALKQLEEALRNSDPEGRQENVRQAQELQQDFSMHLEQAIELLKRLRLEQEVARIADRAQRLAHDQQQLNEARPRGDSADQPESKRQAGEQEQLRKQEAALESDLQELSDQAQDVDQSAAEQLAQTHKQLEQSGTQQAMQQAASSLQQGRPSEAAEPQERARDSLMQASNNLQQLQQSMGMMGGQQVQLGLEELTRDSLYLSRQQERVMQSTSEMESLTSYSAARGKALREGVRREQDTLEGSTRQLSQKLQGLAEQSPMVDPALARKAQGAADMMAQAGREASGGAGPQAGASQREAMARLNELAEDLIRLGESMQQGAQSSAMQQLMQQLQGLAQQQRGLNEGTQQESQRRQGSTPDRDGSQTSLADEQAKIRDALEKLLQRAGEPSGLPDQVGDVPANMGEVEQQLREGRLGRETLSRQQDILHRMLDAQRSVYKKDEQRRRRVAERPKPFQLPPSPPELTPRNDPDIAPSAAPTDDTDLPLDYADLVREYFRALADVD